jgi:hypothetical protein
MNQLKLVLILSFALVLSSLHSARPVRYRYGDAWWFEYEADYSTALLLHFGKAQRKAARELAKEVTKTREKKKSENLFEKELTELEDAEDKEEVGATDFQVAQPESLKKVRRPIDDENVTQDVVLDYGDNRRRFQITRGLKKAPGGRFGDALHCSGEGALVCRKLKFASPLADNQNRTSSGQSLECWIKIEAYPERESCIWWIQAPKETSGGRLLLLSDGRLELKLLHPHGNVSNRLTAEQRDLILAKDPRIISPEPIPLNEWIHIACYNDPPVVQGAGSPFRPRLRFNGIEMAYYLSEVNNGHNFLGRIGEGTLIIGNSDTGDQGFKGLIDEVRLSTKRRLYYDRPLLPWVDKTLKRDLKFDKPYFLDSGTLFHASLDGELKYDLRATPRGKYQDTDITINLEGKSVEDMKVDGIRGRGWIIDPNIALPKLSIEGLDARKGAFEFWLRPENWDNFTGLWPGQRAEPPMHFSVVRFFGKDKRDGATKKFMEVSLPRVRRNDGGRFAIDPGHWNHYVARWNQGAKSGTLFGNGRGMQSVWRAGAEIIENVEPTYAEVGVPHKNIVCNRNLPPLINVDEFVAYNYPLTSDEIRQAMRRWKQVLEPIRTHERSLRYKYSIGRLEFSLQTKLPHDVVPARAAVRLVDANGRTRLGPFEQPVENKKAFFRLCDRQPLPHGKYQVNYQVFDAKGKVVIDDVKNWNFAKEPWRDNRIGILTETPPPWTPVKISESVVETRMTRYELGGNGLPKAIFADGVNLLAGPIRFVEDGKAMRGRLVEIVGSKNVEASWRSRLEGKTCDIDVLNTVEYDGMIRYEIEIKPKGYLAAERQDHEEKLVAERQDHIGPIVFEIPMKSELTTRWMFNASGTTGVRTGIVPSADGEFLSSRHPGFWVADWLARRSRGKKERPKWQEWQSYGFLTQWDLNDMNRGLYWFADHAGGWWQSKKQSAQQFIRDGKATIIRSNLIVEATDYKPGQPIVFGMIPHPARPLDPGFRKLERISQEEGPKLCQAYGSAFKPWPDDPRTHSMKLFPAPDPKKIGDDSSSWEYAERCIPGMKNVQPYGYRSMYLSNYWFSCRAGAYDGWEWRGGPTSQVTHSKSFVDYLCWEMNEWIGRDIFDAIYLDECYEAPSRNVEAGQAILLPDGSVQAGVTLWGFRDLMKRWRNIFHQHGKTPMFTCHLTRSMMYCGMTFVDSYLDGEGHPTITARSRDFVGALSLQRAEVLQNGRMWGIIPAFMASIWEGGLGQGKGWNPHKRWSWRMARGAMSVLAHFENAVTYTDQGGAVYRNYWNDVLKWGAGEMSVPFHPYWLNSKYLHVEGQGKDTLVSFYQKEGRILLIASSRRKEDREIKIKLNLAALGLDNKKVAVKQWDTGYPPAEGEDVLSKAQLAELKKIKAPVTNLLDGGAAGESEFEEEGDLIEELEESEGGKDTPRLEGNVLILPTRARDFRMVSVE